MKLKKAWLIPFGVVVAIAAVLALSLVTLGHAQASLTAQVSPAAPAAAPAVNGIPRYYAIATEGKVSHDEMASITVTVGDVYSGKTVATVALPAISELEGTSSAVGVSAAGDDRTFVVGRRDSWGDTDFFLVHLDPGSRHAAAVRHLAVPETAYGSVLGSAVSPDGKELAVLSARGNGTTLRTYSVRSGAVLRTWTAASWQYQGTQGWMAGVSWTADNRQVGFSTIPGAKAFPDKGALQERVIGATVPSGNLATASRVALKAAPASCTSLLLTPDSGTVVCGTQLNSFFSRATGDCGKTRPMFVAYSARTGQRLRVLYQYPGACTSAEYYVLWSDNAARHVIGEAYTTFSGKPATDRWGVASAGKFTKFAIPRLGQWWSGPAF